MNVFVKIQRFRVGQRFLIVHLSTVNDVADSELGDLAALSARDVTNLDDLRRNMSGAAVLADMVFDFADERFVET